MSSLKLKALALALALPLLFAVFPAQALHAEPEAGSEVSPGDAISYTYTLPADMENCVLRLSLGPGLILRESSVRVESSHAPEVIYGSDGFVVMTDKLDKGDAISFAAEASSAALEIWARITAGDGSIPEEEGYAAHILALPAHAQDTALALPQEGEPDAGRLGVNTSALLTLAALLATGFLGVKLRKGISQRKAARAAAPVAAPAETAGVPETPPIRDNTVEYLTIPEEGLAEERE